jgi:hypothetical protein
MSLQQLTKLQDLKAQAAEIYTKMKVDFTKHRADANKAVLIEMRKHLESNGFSSTLKDGRNRGFVANYKGLQISVESSSDDESYVGADYVIKLTSGTKVAEVDLNVGRIAIPDEPKNGDLDILINEYENKYLLELEDASKLPLSNNHTLSFRVVKPSTGTRKSIANGTEAIEEFCALLSLA